MIVASLPPKKCGIADYTEKLLASLSASSEITMHVVTQVGTGNKNLLPHVRMHNVIQGWRFRDLAHIQKTVRAIKPDIIHFQHPGKAYGKNFSQFFIPYYLRKKNQAKTIITLHEYTQAPWYAKPWILFLAKTATAIICTNEDDMARLSIRYKTHIPIASNIIPTRQAPEERDQLRARLLGGKKFLIGYFGFADSDKGIDKLLVATAELIHKRRLQCKLLLITELRDENAYHAHLKKLIHTLALQDTVLVTGYLPEARVSAHLATLDLCVFPFRQSGSLRRGSVVAALAHGLPILTKSFVSAVAVNKKNILMYEKNDALSESIHQAIKHPDMLKSVKKGALALKTRFDWQHIAHRTIDFYQKIAQLDDR